jgi:hypothetical protein
MFLREWRRLVLSRQILRRRFFGVPVFIVIVIAVLHTVLYHQLAPLLRFEREVTRTLAMPSYVGMQWTAEYDESRDLFHIIQHDDDGWMAWMRARFDARKTDEEMPWAASFTTNQSPGFWGHQLWVHLSSAQPPGELDALMPRATDEIEDAFHQSHRGRRFPGAVRDAELSVDGQARLYRVSPPLALWTLSVIIAWLAVLGALAGTLVPRRRELSAFRQAEGMCVRCRYPVRDTHLRICPECGSEQVG